MKSGKAKMDISSPEYRDLVQNLLGKKISLEPLPTLAIPTSPIPLASKKIESSLPPLSALPILSSATKPPFPVLSPAHPTKVPLPVLSPAPPTKVPLPVLSYVPEKGNPSKLMKAERVTRSKDVDTLVLNKLDDKDLLSMLQVNRDYRDLSDDYFKDRLRERYPNLVPFKPEQKTWKEYYFHNTDYIRKLKSEYDLDYVSFPGTSSKPESIYKQLYQNICIFVKNSRRADAKEIKRVSQKIIDEVRMKFYVYEKKRKEILRFLEDEDNKSEIYDIAEEVLKMGDLEFYKVLKKKNNRIGEKYRNEIPFEDMVFKAIEDGDMKSVTRHFPELLKYYENYVNPFAEVGSSESFYRFYSALLGRAVIAGESEIVKYLTVNAPVKDKEEYEKMFVNNMVKAIKWDDESIFEYLYNKVVSFKNKALLKVLRSEIKNVAICVSGGKKYLNYKF